MKRISNILLIFFIFVTSIVLTSCDKKPTIYEYVETDIVVETGEYKLPGKLTIPESKQKVPGVIFVHGSGANDMDESIGALKLFEELAIKLAKKGVKVHRDGFHLNLGIARYAASLLWYQTLNGRPAEIDIVDFDVPVSEEEIKLVREILKEFR